MKRRLLVLVLTILVFATAASAASAWYYYPWEYTTPVTSCFQITQWYGPGSYSHTPGSGPDDEMAVDVGTYSGTPIYATHEGWIHFEGWQRDAYGNYGPGGIMIRLRSMDGLETVYAHLSQTIIDNGQLVAKNQLLGYSGGSGYGMQGYWAPHLHWAIRVADGPALAPDDIPGVNDKTWESPYWYVCA